MTAIDTMTTIDTMITIDVVVPTIYGWHACPDRATYRRHLPGGVSVGVDVLASPPPQPSGVGDEAQYRQHRVAIVAWIAVPTGDYGHVAAEIRGARPLAGETLTREWGWRAASREATSVQHVVSVPGHRCRTETISGDDIDAANAAAAWTSAVATADGWAAEWLAELATRDRLAREAVMCQAAVLAQLPPTD